VKVFGSQMTKILTPSSDLDLAILNVPEESGNVIDMLYDLEKAISAKGKKEMEGTGGEGKERKGKGKKRSTGRERKGKTRRKEERRGEK
jgi:hypothetical protein